MQHMVCEAYACLCSRMHACATVMADCVSCTAELLRVGESRAAQHYQSITARTADR